MKRLARYATGMAFLAGAALLGQPASAVFLSFEQWSALPASQEAIYIAGAFDSLVVYGADAAAERRNAHYESCVIDAKLTSGDLAAKVREFGSMHQELRTAPVQAALVQYLFSLCGAPPDQ